MVKKIFSIMLMLLMVLSLLPVKGVKTYAEDSPDETPVISEEAEEIPAEPDDTIEVEVEEENEESATTLSEEPVVIQEEELAAALEENASEPVEEAEVTEAEAEPAAIQEDFEQLQKTDNEADDPSGYNVEFTYEDLQYVLPGGTSVLLSEVLETVGLSKETSYACSSNPELFSVEKIDGVWTVISHRSFTSIETLTVTIDGVDYVITVTDPEDETYKVWVGSTQVTSANKDNIVCSGGGSAKYDPATKTLTFTNAKITDYYNGSYLPFCIVSNESELTIKGKVSVSHNTEGGIAVAEGNNRGDLTIDGDVEIVSSESGIYAGDFVINSGTVNITSVSRDGIDARNVTIEDGDVTVRAESNGRYGIIASGTVLIKGGAVGVSSNSINNYGINCNDIAVSGGTVIAEGSTAFKSVPSLSDYANPLVTAGTASYSAQTWDGTTALNTYHYVKIEPGITSYPIWIGSTQVTAANKDDILGDGGKAKYDPSTQTLTLNDPTIIGYAEGTGVCILAQGVDLTIKGKATIENGQYGIQVDGGSLTLNGNFAVTNNGYCAVEADSVTIEGGTVNLTSYHAGINSIGNVTVSDGTVIASSTEGYGIKAGGSITIKGGTVTAFGKVSAFSTEPSLTDYPNPLVTVGQDENNANTWDGTTTLKTYHYVKIEPGTVVTKYPVWVGSTQVTSANKDDILGDGGKAKYDPSTQTLTLNDPTITTLYIDGNNNRAQIYTTSDLTITGSATLENSDADLGILSIGPSISISGNITAKGKISGINAMGDITITGDSTVITAEGETFGIDTYNNIYIKGGTVSATGTDSNTSHGIFTESEAIVIGSGAKKVTASGTTSAICAYSSSITIESPLIVVTPAGGSVSSDGKNIVDVSSNIATYAVISQGEALPEVTGIKANVTGRQENNGNYDVITDTLETLFDSTTAPVTMFTSVLYSDQDCQNKLTAEPVSGTTYYFYIGVNAYNDGDPATVTWAQDEDLKTNSVLTANGAEVKILNLVHSAASGSLSVICSYKEDVSPIAITYTVESGGNSTWTRGSGNDVTITVKRNVDDNTCFSHFTGVQIDNTTLVNGTDYTAASGSTIIKLKASALNNLSAGTKTVTINFDDGSASTNLTIKVPSQPENKKYNIPITGIEKEPEHHGYMVLLSCFAIAELLVMENKRRNSRKH